MVFSFLKILLFRQPHFHVQVYFGFFTKTLVLHHMKVGYKKLKIGAAEKVKRL